MPKHTKLLIIGGGPAALSAAITAGYEGIPTVLLEKARLGGRIACSSMTQNYLGFEKISGHDLMERAISQVERMGTRIIQAEAFSIQSMPDGSVQVATDSGVITATAVLLCLGLSYSNLPIDGCNELMGKGISYIPSMAEQKAVTGKNVVIVGSGNSAGQCALFLSQRNNVAMLLKGKNDTMSGLLHDQVMRVGNIHMLPCARILSFEKKSDKLVSMQVDTEIGITKIYTDHCFVFVGTKTASSWLPDSIQRDPDGYIITNTSYQTSLPGVYAAGDCRMGAVGRVASAVGEGASAVKYIKDRIDARSTTHP